MAAVLDLAIQTCLLPRRRAKSIPALARQVFASAAGGRFLGFDPATASFDSFTQVPRADTLGANHLRSNGDFDVMASRCRVWPDIRQRRLLTRATLRVGPEGFVSFFGNRVRLSYATANAEVHLNQPPA